MKTRKHFLALAFLALSLVACSTQVIVEEEIVVVDPDPIPQIALSTVLNSHELWYVNIDRSSANANIPFLQKAFTVSFLNGTFWANNNLVGIGNQGNGFGIDVGYYDTFEYDYVLDVYHDLDGLYSLEVTRLNNNELKLYYRPGNMTYILEGAQRATFDYNRLFYDNIHYFLQEYQAWEKVYTSDYGVINEFDNENFVQFLPGGGQGNFRSSQDPSGTLVNFLYWDYTGIYNVANVAGNDYLKQLTLDYDFLGNEFFELSVINDSTVAFYHPDSGTLYRFKGRGYIPYKRAEVKRESNATIASQIIKIEQDL